jgi:hypothetical protein
MKFCRCLLSSLFWTLLLSPVFAPAQQPWTNIITPGRAANWTSVGLPGDVLPDGSWTQSGNTIAACGSSGSPVSPSSCGITSALSACGTNHYVLLAGTPATPSDFYLNANLPSIPSNCVLRGGGANATRLHFASGGTYACSGTAISCIGASSFYSGTCSGGTYWPCPPSRWTTSAGAATANWTSGYLQGSTTITLDSVTGITVNVTPIILDQCDVGFTGNSSNSTCAGTAGGAGAITAATVYAGGSGYSVGDTFTIGYSVTNGTNFGESPIATAKVTSVSGGAVTGISITSGGGGYGYTSTGLFGMAYVTTTATSGSGSGLELSLTGINSYDNNGIFACVLTQICSVNAASNTQRPARSETEVVLATSITGSGPYTVTLNRPIIHPDWGTAGRSPQAYWPKSGTVTNAGIEDLELDGSAISAGASAIEINNATKVWVSGVASNKANFFHVAVGYSSNVLVANSYFYWTTTASTTSYGIGTAAATGGALFENNILQGIPDAINIAAGCTGCVAAYNFGVNPYDTASAAMFPMSGMHASSTDYVLNEGNIGSTVNLDDTHGPHFLNTFFRNYMAGYESNNGTLPYQNTIPFIIGAFSRYSNFLDNVGGTAGYHTIYECIPASATQQHCAADAGSYAGYVHIWDIGWPTPAQADYSNPPQPTPNDLLTSTSLFRYGNCDVVSSPSCQYNTAEVPVNDLNFPISAPTTRAFPASFYDGVTSFHSSCGTGLSFWKNPITGTCPQYPPIGPDVSEGDIGMCTSGTYNWSRVLDSAQCAGGNFNPSVNGGYANSNPAMRCYLNQMSGAPNGTGSMLSFSRATCYAADPSSGTSSPASPAGVQANPMAPPS